MDIQPFLTESARLQAEVPAIKTETSPEVIKGEIAIRKRFRVQIREKKGEVSRQIAKLQEAKRDLDIADQYQGADIDELEEVKWEALRNRKAAESPHGVQPEDALIFTQPYPKPE
jgi:capsule polysaccharide export protein KpsE/RkpR